MIKMRDVYHADISHFFGRVYSTEPPEEPERARFFVYKKFIFMEIYKIWEKFTLNPKKSSMNYDISFYDNSHTFYVIML